VSEEDPDRSVDYEAENRNDEYEEQPYGIEAEKSGGSNIKGDKGAQEDKEEKEGEFDAAENDVVMEMMKEIEKKSKRE